MGLRTLSSDESAGPGRSFQLKRKSIKAFSVLYARMYEPRTPPGNKCRNCTSACVGYHRVIEGKKATPTEFSASSKVLGVAPTRPF